jgi:hypothetical protein
MSSNFSLYHEALRKLIESVFSGQVVLEEVDAAYDNAIKQVKGNLKFPFISLYPTPTIEFDNSKNSFPSYHVGNKMYTEVPVFNEYGEYIGSDDKVAKNVKSLYINIEYQIDVWAIDRQTAEEVIRELMFWFYENQELSVTFYGQPLTFTFTVGNNIQDNTDLVNYESNGKIYRYTTNILLSTAIFRTENYFTVQKPKVDIAYIISNEEDKKVKEVKE